MLADSADYDADISLTLLATGLSIIGLMPLRQQIWLSLHSFDREWDCHWFPDYMISRPKRYLTGPPPKVRAPIPHCSDLLYCLFTQQYIDWRLRRWRRFRITPDCWFVAWLYQWWFASSFARWNNGLPAISGRFVSRETDFTEQEPMYCASLIDISITADFRMNTFIFLEWWPAPFAMRGASFIFYFACHWWRQMRIVKAPHTACIWRLFRQLPASTYDTW